MLCRVTPRCAMLRYAAFRLVTPRRALQRNDLLMARLKKRDRGVRDLYQKQKWRNIRRHQLQIEPICAIHLRKGEVVAAVIADHIEPHRGDLNKFWFGKLQSLCVNCHNSLKHIDELRERSDFLHDIGEDGWPIDPRHPSNQRASHARRRGAGRYLINPESCA